MHDLVANEFSNLINSDLQDGGERAQALVSRIDTSEIMIARRLYRSIQKMQKYVGQTLPTEHQAIVFERKNNVKRTYTRLLFGLCR